MPAKPTHWLWIALIAMFGQQTVVALAKVIPGVAAKPIVEELSLDPALLGVYVGIVAMTALAVQAGCGSFIIRYGPLRMSQIALVLTGAGLVLATPGFLLLFALSAVIVGGFAVSTPASSHLLRRYSTPQIAPLVFSLKQTAVPAGFLLGGLIVPALIGWVDWRAAMWIVAAFCVIVAVILQPLRREFDSDRIPTRVFAVSDFKGTISAVLSDKNLRSLAMACFAFNGVQSVFIAYVVIYLTELGHSLEVAGFVFSVATAVAIPSRIFWGWLSAGRISPRRVMAILSLTMAVGVGAFAFFTASWSIFLIGAVASAASLTALSWQGVLLAETANCAPDGMVAGATGGVLAFGQFGALTMPPVYALALTLTGSYGIGFVLAAVPAFIIGLILLRPSPQS